MKSQKGAPANTFAGAMLQLQRATEVQVFDNNLMYRLQKPEREVTVSIPVSMDDGTLKMFEGYRVQYSSICGPYKGGVRYHTLTDADEVRALAFWMTIKTALTGLPMGGGKGGITVDPKTLSSDELERLSRGWVRLLKPVIGPTADIPAPDVNTTSEIIGWMADEYAVLSGDTTGAAFTGKPLVQGGSEGRSTATGTGGYYVFEALHEKLNIPSAAAVAVQGMGNVGISAAEIFTQNGHKVIAMSDSKGAILNEKGLDPSSVEAHKKSQGSLVGYPEAQSITNEELLLLPVDVLIPAALENQITSQNAADIRAKVILELANGPTTTEADDLLFARGVHVIPDILANSGGVIVSTFEWQQNLAREHWKEQIVLKKLREVLVESSVAVWEKSVALKTDLRRAAFVLALERLKEKLQ